MKNFLLKKYKINKKPLLKKINLFDNLSIKKVLFISPFFFGLTQTFYKKYKQDSFYFLSQNINIEKKKNEEKISWESFNFFKLKEIPETNIKTFNVYKNLLLLDLKKPIQINFLGIIKKKNISDLKKLNNKYVVIKIEEMFNFSEFKISNINNFQNFLKDKNEFFYKNDRIPKKLNKLFLIQKNVNYEKVFLEEKPFHNASPQKDFFEQEKINKKKLQRIILEKKLNNKKNLFIIKENKNNNFFYSKKPLTEKNFDKLLNRFFYINNLRIVTTTGKYKKAFFTFTNKYNQLKKSSILQVIEKNNKIYKTKKIEKRLLSGYNYIDSNQIESLYFVKKSLFAAKKVLKIILPSNLFLFNYSTNKILSNKLLLLTNSKNGFFGLSLKKKQNKILSQPIFLSFQKNLKPQVKKFRKIDDFYSEKISIKYLKEQNFFKKQKNHTLENSYQLADKQIEKFFINKKNNFYTLSKQPIFFMSQKNFVENWEYISFMSWIFITKFLLMIYVCYILKEIYKDYGRELINYLIEYGKTSQIDFENLKEQYFYEDLSFRVIKQTNKKIKNISGIDSLLPEIGEIILLLRNSKQTKKLKKSTPKGFLLAGPPGNGKTLLVQAIAGESKIPVIIQSGSLLINTKDQSQGHKKLKKIFGYAKKISPSIIFIDEIDSLGEKRKNVLKNSLVSDRNIEFLYSIPFAQNKILIPKPLSNDRNSPKSLKNKSFDFTNDENILFDDSNSINIETKKMKLNILTQFLIEMDGIENQTNFIVFGATNRLQTLDPAFTRPGRFNKIIILDVPSKKKRIQILKFYSKNRKIEKKISWNYLGKKTTGFTASELASIMNESSIQSILKKSTHTLETIEKGIDYITSYSNSKTNKINKVINFSYYQAGKAIGLNLLNKKSENLIINLNLWNRKKNTRHDKMYQTLISQTQTKVEFEKLLIFLNLGKSTEFLRNYGKKKFTQTTYFNSIIGIEDQKIIQYIGFLIVTRWYFYSLNILLKEENQTLVNYHFQHQNNYSSLINKSLLQEFKIEKINNFDTPSNYQENGVSTVWQYKVGSKMGDIKKSLIDWYRLYIPDPEEKFSNIDWIPPDLYIHANSTLKNFSMQSNINFNNIYKLERDFLFQCIILNTFNIATIKIEKNREIVDAFATHILRYGILRENEIKKNYKIK